MIHLLVSVRPIAFRLYLLGLLFISTTLPAQVTRYVSTTGTNNNPATATSWATSTTNLQGAINASASGNEVWVAKGTYKPTSTTAPTDRTASFAMKNGVAIYGGFAGGETLLTARNWPANPTLLSGEIGDPASTTDNSYHVISNPAGLTTTALLDGFIVTSGRADGADFNEVGGGVFNNGSGSYCNPQFRNCTFRQNIATYGGAICNFGQGTGQSSPLVLNCVFESNIASAGGSMYNAGANGGQSSPKLTNCVFQSNTATGSGGGLYNDGSGNGTSSPILTNCSFQGNQGFTGAALCTDVYGGGTSMIVLLNGAFWDNGGASTLFVNGTGVSSMSATYCLFESSVAGYTSSPTNLTATTSPFMSAISTQLVACSPAINFGDPTGTSATVGSTDAAGNARFVSGRIDIGAYEFQGAFNPVRLFVNATASGANTGESWADAFTDLQTALSSPCGAEVWVAKGTYKPTSTTAPTDRTASFTMRTDRAIYGGFAGGETLLSARNWPANPTLLSGEIGDPASTTDNSYHVISNVGSLTTTAILDGFIITGGHANGTGTNGYGGGMANSVISDRQVCSPYVRNCMFQNNRAHFGGAVYNNSYYGTNSSQFTNCVFRENTATQRGGVMFNTGDIIGNSAPQLTNCSLYNNTAASGGAMYNVSNALGRTIPLLINCILWNNAGANTFVNIANNGGASTVSAIYSLFEPAVTGYSSSPTNLTTVISPFASTTSAQLVLCSSAINAGDPTTTTATVGTTDLAGNPRIVNGQIDMGAYEYQGALNPVRFYVNSGATGMNTGLSWADAFTDLQTALSSPCTTDIWVAKGTYKPTSTTARTASFAMKNDVVIYGGFAGGETLLTARNWTINSTILSGEIGDPTSTTDNSYHVISNVGSLTTTAMLDGFIITGGHANGTGTNSQGGGMYNTANVVDEICSPSVRNCVFQNNRADFGGAMYNYGGYGNSNPQVTNCVFQSNTATNQGGAMYNGGTFGNGGSPQLTNCLFQNNRAGYGGAMVNYGTSSALISPKIWNTSFQSNTASFGGAIYNYGGDAYIRPQFTNCRFQDNRAISNGGVFYNSSNTFGQSSPQLTNCVLQSNAANGTGGVLYNEGSYNGNSNLQFTNCTLLNNTANGGGAIYNYSNAGKSNTQLTNCIVWNNGGASSFENLIQQNGRASVSATYSLFELTVANYLSNSGNITTSTLPFISTTSAQLTANSLAINAGDPTTTSATVGMTDLAGNPRFVNGRIDMGAYEGPLAVYTLKTGLWNDPTVWSVNRVPVAGEGVEVRHVVTIPASYSALCGRLALTTGGSLRYVSTARLRLEL